MVVASAEGEASGQVLEALGQVLSGAALGLEGMSVAERQCGLGAEALRDSKPQQIHLTSVFLDHPSLKSHISRPNISSSSKCTRLGLGPDIFS